MCNTSLNNDISVKEQHHGLPILYHVLIPLYDKNAWYTLGGIDTCMYQIHTPAKVGRIGRLWLILEDDFEVGWVEIGIAFWNRYNGFSDYFGWETYNFVGSIF